jgi:O-antigen/teichoic acid export membrane protein
LAGGLVVLLGGSFVAENIGYVLDIAPGYEDDARLMFLLLVIAPGVRTILMPFMVGLQVKQKFVFLSVLGFCHELLKAAIMFGLLYGVSTRVLWVVVAALPPALLEIIISFTVSRRLVPSLRFRRSEIRRELIRPILSFGSSVLVARAASVVRENAGPLLLNHLSNPVQVASNRMGSYVETRFYPAILGPMLTVQPALTAMHAMGSDERLRRTYFRMSRYLLWVFLFFTVPGMVYNRELWDLYLGADIVALKCPEAGIVLVLLMGKSFFVFAQPVLAQVALAKAKAGAMAVRVLAIEGSTVLVIWYLVAFEDMGATGVALATLSVAAVGGPLLLWPFGLHLTGGKASEFLRETVLRGLIPAMCAAPVWVGLWLNRPPQSWLEFFGFCAAGWVVYAAVLLIFLLEPHEREDMGKVLAGLKRRLF